MLNLSGRELLTGPEPPFSRRQYFRTGLALMLLKYVVDAALIYWRTGLVWTPVDYVLSLANLAGSKAAAFPVGLSVTLLIWSLPFVWVGVLLSVRRARDAGFPAWVVVFFFVPVLNYLLMLALAVAPTAKREVEPIAEPVRDEGSRSRIRGVIAGVVSGVLIGVGSIAFGVLLIRTYGFAVFVLTPFLIGAASAFAARRVDPNARQPVALVLLTLLVIGCVSMLIAMEGAACILMAAPLAVPIAILGGLVGHSMARRPQAPGTLAMVVMLLPVSHGIDAATQLLPSREVYTALEIAAPPETVWRHVVSFEEIRTPPAWYFRMGLAYPLRARIHGTGPGAVRLCEFTTGVFTEPITAWEAPYRLAFDVTSQPAPLAEWSPYQKVYAPHLEGFFRTTKGEFRLVALPAGRTRLEGRTWYTLRMQPHAYWTVFADTIVHRIHERVLDHIKKAAEAP